MSKDIRLLRDFSYKIGLKMNDHKKEYYVDNCGFSVAELKIMIDAIQIAAFVTRDKTEDSVNRITAMGGTRKVDIIKSNIVCFNTRKCSNEAIYDNVERFLRNVADKQESIILHFDKDEKGKRVYRKGKKRYEIEPMPLLFHEDIYYLMYFSPKDNDIINYRADRMEGVLVENKPVISKTIIYDSNKDKYTEQAFKMYGGLVTDVTIEFDDG